jgi:hypothetical protein
VARPLVRHRVARKNRVPAILLAFGRPSRSPTGLGAGGRQLLARLGCPARGRDTAAAVALIDDLDAPVDGWERELGRLGPNQAAVSLLRTAPGIGWVLGDRIAAELGDWVTWPAPSKLVGASGRCPRVWPSGSREHRGPLATNGGTRDRRHRQPCGRCRPTRPSAEPTAAPFDRAERPAVVLTRQRQDGRRCRPRRSTRRTVPPMACCTRRASHSKSPPTPQVSPIAK